MSNNFAVLCPRILRNLPRKTCNLDTDPKLAKVSGKIFVDFKGLWFIIHSLSRHARSACDLEKTANPQMCRFILLNFKFKK